MVLSRLPLLRSLLGAFLFTVTGSNMFGQETSFAEKFALARDREAVLRDLIPGTDEYFYYHGVHFQTVGKLSESRRYVDAWIAQAGLNEKTRPMLTRQLLLEYPSHPQATIDHLIRDYGIYLSHPAPQKDEAATLSSRLAPNAVNWKQILEDQVKVPNQIHQIETPYIVGLAHLLSDPADVRNWIGRIQRVDAPALVETILKELRDKDSAGFGWAPIHKQLTIDQLQSLREQLPTLAQSGTFVEAYLKRLRPGADESLADANTKLAFLERLEAFITTLPESHNSLIAHVLFHRLQFDANRTIFDRPRFMRYLRLPIARPYCSQYMQRNTSRSLVNLESNFQSQTGLAAIRDDSALIRQHLEHFFQKDESIDDLAEYLDRDFLGPVFASTKILYGTGDPKTYFAQLSPEAQRELQARIEVKFAPSNPTYFQPTDNVRLDLDIKNVSNLLVRIYRLNARNILAQQQSAISTAIDLDGLVANSEKRLEFAMPPERRHRATLDLPELSGAGVWVVECLAGGQRSRALIHKGHLQSIQTISDAGHVLRIMNERGEWVKTAKVLIGEREFQPDSDGEILIPFAETTQVKSIVLCDGNFATLESFVHKGESYELTANFLLDSQSILAGSRTAVAIRANLLLDGDPIPLENVKDVVLRITSTDLDGISSSQTVENLELDETMELIHPFIVPPRLASVSMTLEGKVLTLNKKILQPVSASYSARFNETTTTSLIHDFYLTRTNRGYRVELIGRNGEPKPRQPLDIQLKFLAIEPWQSHRLATDEHGFVELGELAGVSHIKLSAHGMQDRQFSLLTENNDLPRAIHALADTKIEIPSRVLEESIASQLVSRWTLNELRDDVIVKNYNSRLTHKEGHVEVAGLPPGRFQLVDHWLGVATYIDVTKGQSRDGVLVGEHRTLAENTFSPVRIQSINVVDGKIRIKLNSADSYTRVHVIGTAYDQSRAHLFAGASRRLPMPSIDRRRVPSFYVDSLKLDDEYQYVLARQTAKKYPGNMLPHPSVILNPWEISTTRSESQLPGMGDSIPSKETSPRLAPAAPNGDANRADEVAKLSQDFEFLARGSLLMVNQRPDNQGELVLEADRFTGLPSVTIVVVHPTMTISERIALPLDTARSLRDRRLAHSFEATKRYSRQNVIRLLQPSDRLDLGEASLTRVRVYSSIRDLFPLYQSYLHGNAELEKFRCLAQWSTLSEDQKRVRYSELACHELHLFLYHHDRPFFDKVVRPHLVNKQAKQFLDDWLLDRDLSKYLTPWQIQRMNAAERVLLAKKIDAQAIGQKRWLVDYLSAFPISKEQQSASFETSLRWMELGEDFPRRGYSQLGPKSKEAIMGGGMGGMGGMGTMEMEMGGETLFFEQSQNRPDHVNKSDQSPGRMQRRGAAKNRALTRFFESLEATKKWAESHYYKVHLALQIPDLIKPNAFWLDYLNHDGKSPFLSNHLAEASTNVNEALMAMAVIGLPLEAKPAELTFEDNRLVAKGLPASIAYIQGINENEASADASKLLVSRDIFPFLADENTKPLDPRTLVKGVPYRSRVVITNPTSSKVAIQLFTQVPSAAIPLEGAKTISVSEVELAPYGTQVVVSSFYFPASGEFEFYGAQLSSEDKHVHSTGSVGIKVLDRPESIDDTTWEYTAAWGTTEQVIAALKKANLNKIDLSLIGWRLSDSNAWNQILQTIEESGRFDDTTWSYSLMHRDVHRMREYLNNHDGLVGVVGPAFHSDLLVVDPVERFRYEHLDFRPIVVARMHQLGQKRVILNDGLAAQYESFMQFLSCVSKINDDHRMSLVYYLILQNRIGEALEHFRQIDREKVAGHMQYDYFDAYLALFTSEYDRASAIAQRYAEYPVPRWRDWFLQIDKQISDRKRLEAGESIASVTSSEWEADPTQRLLSSAREGQLETASTQLPALNLSQEGNQLFVEYRNIDSMKINYYLMDVELLFSRNPFVQQTGTRSAVTEPNQSELIKLEKKGRLERWTWRQPAELANKNLVVEFVADGIVRSVPIYANSLSVSLSTTIGRLQVQITDRKKPLEGAYVKVYARHRDGSVRFFKDGYTDLRGQFDYATLSTGDLSTTQRLSILVLHPEFGALIRECDPPKFQTGGQ